VLNDDASPRERRRMLRRGVKLRTSRWPVLVATVALAACAALSPAARAQGYPERPIHVVVVAQSATMMRALEPLLTRSLGTPIVIETIGGAGGTIAAQRVAQTRPDGYTLLVAGLNNIVLAPLLRSHPGYDPATDLKPLGGIASVPYGIAVGRGIPAENLRELIAYARAHPGELSFASGGAGSSSHLAIELLKSRAGIDMLHVPYRGTPLALPDLIAGRIDVVASDLAELLPHARAGEIRLVAVGGRQRAKTAPDVPTVAEQGLPGFAVEPWYGLYAPAGIPEEAAERLSSALAEALESEEVRRSFADMGREPMPLAPQALEAFAVSESAKYAALIDAAGLRNSQ
jgi:tripartite-type tricarboxylate transporter receptor subunit TctC